ncbi:MAG: MGMT family protein [Patescibacteria group bacterium]
MENKSISIKEAVKQVVNRIPKGRVAYYGQISQILAHEFSIFVSAQLVGWTLNGYSEAELEDIAWQRVISKKGHISLLKTGFRGNHQISLLESEGVVVEEGLVDMNEYCVELDDLLSQ